MMMSAYEELGKLVCQGEDVIDVIDVIAAKSLLDELEELFNTKIMGGISEDKDIQKNVYYLLLHRVFDECQSGAITWNEDVAGVVKQCITWIDRTQINASGNVVQIVDDIAQKYRVPHLFDKVHKIAQQVEAEQHPYDTLSTLTINVEKPASILEDLASATHALNRLARMPEEDRKTAIPESATSADNAFIRLTRKVFHALASGAMTWNDDAKDVVKQCMTFGAEIAKWKVRATEDDLVGQSIAEQRQIGALLSIMQQSLECGGSTIFKDVCQIAKSIQVRVLGSSESLRVLMDRATEKDNQEAISFLREEINSLKSSLRSDAVDPLLGRPVVSDGTIDRAETEQNTARSAYRTAGFAVFSKTCKEQHLDPNDIICLCAPTALQARYAADRAQLVKETNAYFLREAAETGAVIDINRRLTYCSDAASDVMRQDPETRLSALGCAIGKVVLGSTALGDRGTLSPNIDNIAKVTTLLQAMDPVRYGSSHQYRYGYVPLHWALAQKGDGGQQALFFLKEIVELRKIPMLEMTPDGRGSRGKLPSFDVLFSIKDTDGNNLLHLAAQNSPAVFRFACEQLTPQKAAELLAEQNAAGKTPMVLVVEAKDKEKMEVISEVAEKSLSGIAGECARDDQVILQARLQKLSASLAQRQHSRFRSDIAREDIAHFKKFLSDDSRAQAVSGLEGRHFGKTAGIFRLPFSSTNEYEKLMFGLNRMVQAPLGKFALAMFEAQVRMQHSALARELYGEAAHAPAAAGPRV
jgi:hypothetical protein